MAVVSEKLSGQFGSEMTSDVIWGKLRTMFDLSAVDDREEAIPFTLEEREFALPRKDFISLINDKQKEINRVISKYLVRANVKIRVFLSRTSPPVLRAPRA